MSSDHFLMSDNPRWGVLPGSVFWLHIGGDGRELRYAAKPWGGLPTMRVVVVQDHGRLWEEIKVRARVFPDGQRAHALRPAEQSGFRVHFETAKAIVYRREIILQREAKSP